MRWPGVCEIRNRTVKDFGLVVPEAWDAPRFPPLTSGSETMITRQELERKWNEVKGRIQQKWGALTDDDLQRVRGNANALVGVIEQKTGESRRAIEDFLDQAIASGASVVGNAMESAREFAGKATEF